MSARAIPYYNAWTESFQGTLKREMLQGGCFTGDYDARPEILSFIEGYYNTRRRHASLVHSSPARFKAKLNSSN